jgi:hypothetical protein
MLCCVFLLASVVPTNAAAAKEKLEAQLIWGTNDQTPNTKYPQLEAPLAKKLKMFKWKDYYLVNRQEIPVAAAPQKIKLSEKCEIEVKHLDGSRYEVNVFGKGKHVLKKVGKITSKEPLVIAGDDKNDCAWLILIRGI